uniref:caffeoylshikimate esterase-like n=1 Tax=Erigeron canadensis TaxID=72917 RepID=UPI001CB96B11|nr:caffeoylshikimate esterase-like [Erigeron canadensis]
MPPPPNLPTLPPPPPFFWGKTPEDEYYKSQGVRNSKSYFQTPYAKIFTQSWHPLDETQPLKAVVFMTHGYASDSSWCFQNICIAYAKWGYAVYAADLIGHGRTDGLHGYIGDMDKAAATSLSFFIKVRESEQYRDLPAFLLGESMGALITMLMFFQSYVDTWTGLIFLSPLFVTPPDMTPSKLHLIIYGLLYGLADTWAVMPNPPMVTKAVRDMEKLKILAVNPKLYTGKPRVGTMREVVRVTAYVRKNFDKVRVPFFTAHGLADGLASHTGSEMLYDKAGTPEEDKALKLYEGMYHSLINGEPDECVDLVLADMKAWIDEMAQKYGPIVFAKNHLNLDQIFNTPN